MGGQTHAPATLLSEETQYLLCSRLGGPQGRSGRVRKMSPSHRDSIPGPSSPQRVAVPTVPQYYSIILVMVVLVTCCVLDNCYCNRYRHNSEPGQLSAVVFSLRPEGPKYRGLTPGRGEIFFISQSTRISSRPPPSLVFNGYRGGSLSPWAKWPGREAGNSLPSMAFIACTGKTLPFTLQKQQYTPSTVLTVLRFYN